MGIKDHKMTSLTMQGLRWGRGGLFVRSAGEVRRLVKEARLTPRRLGILWSFCSVCARTSTTKDAVFLQGQPESAEKSLQETYRVALSTHTHAGTHIRAHISTHRHTHTRRHSHTHTKAHTHIHARTHTHNSKQLQKGPQCAYNKTITVPATYSKKKSNQDFWQDEVSSGQTNSLIFAKLTDMDRCSNMLWMLTPNNA